MKSDPVVGMMRLHASCVAIAGKGVLLLGPSGSGKSDLCLRLIDRGAKLVSDDQVNLRREGIAISASAPMAGRGLIEMRGIGIVRMPMQEQVSLALAVQLEVIGKRERMPDPEYFNCLGVAIPQIAVHAFELSAMIKVEHALSALYDDSMVAGSFKG